MSVDTNAMRKRAKRAEDLCCMDIDIAQSTLDAFATTADDALELCDEVDELRATLAAERGDAAGAVEGWSPAGRDRWEHPRAKVWWHNGWRWGLYPVKGDFLRATTLGGLAEGTAETAREAMRQATAALKERP